MFHPEKYRWLRENFRPVGHVGYSHLLFRITPEELAALPAARRRHERAASQGRGGLAGAAIRRCSRR